MCEERPAFCRRLAELVELGAIEFRPKPLNAIVERSLKAIWTAQSVPELRRGHTPRTRWFRSNLVRTLYWKATYTRGTPFYDSELAPGEFLIAFVLYVDTLLSINQIAFLLRRATRRSTRKSESWKQRSFRASRYLGTDLPDSRWPDAS